MEKALDDVTGLDLGRVIAMPYCTMLLADLGPRVIKVESRGQGQEPLCLGIKRVWKNIHNIGSTVTQIAPVVHLR
jgi:crotonobetainyl-CoA:carnitine CoA-transferase CaiB-like acyl-CoA transferase